MFCNYSVPIHKGYVIFLAVNMLSAIVLIFVTGVVSVVIYRKKSLRTISNVLFLHLFCALTIRGAVIAPIRSVFMFCQYSTKNYCYYMVTISKMCGYVFIFCLIFITLDRYLKIRFKKIHRAVFHGMNLFKITSASWIVATLLAFVIDVDFTRLNTYHEAIYYRTCYYTDIIRREQHMIWLIGIQTVPIIAVLLIHILIIFYIRKRFNAVRNTINTKNLTGSSAKFTEKVQIKQKSELDLAIMTFSMIASYIITVYPLVIVDLLRTINSYRTTKAVYVPPTVLNIVYSWSTLQNISTAFVFLYYNKPLWTNFTAIISFGTSFKETSTTKCPQTETKATTTVIQP